ncbi:Glycerol-3-phosphate dehydrogenase [NAD(P)+] [Frankliniella fusca]|uniref:Glycerol-3-phosphate dehydrogenase [NAD(P)+] n=1 Tax=Frankliniella fusca TaxID=407009 RepID=A0AAE1L5Q0_9NEOP|nr:Glycerol-3-phosphate dehydrogenase [NAD(P)+] [Frankliniella fusca]
MSSLPSILISSVSHVVLRRLEVYSLRVKLPGAPLLWLTDDGEEPPGVPDDGQSSGSGNVLIRPGSGLGVPAAGDLALLHGAIDQNDAVGRELGGDGLGVHVVGELVAARELAPDVAVLVGALLVLALHDDAALVLEDLHGELLGPELLHVHVDEQAVVLLGHLILVLLVLSLQGAAVRGGQVSPQQVAGADDEVVLVVLGLVVQVQEAEHGAGRAQGVAVGDQVVEQAQAEVIGHGDAASAVQVQGRSQIVELAQDKGVFCLHDLVHFLVSTPHGEKDLSWGHDIPYGLKFCEMS